MLKRFVAFLFILTIVGQVYAGVCGCVNGESSSKHSCCKRQNSAGDSVSKKSCCDTDCIAKGTQQPTQDRTTASAKIKFEATKQNTAVPTMAFERIVASGIVRTPSVANHRLKFSGASELYLRHRAFLL